MKDESDNPFRPGAGKLPPVRAGHEKAARVLKAGLRSARERDQGDIIVLFGPRGNGKTTLMTELRKSVTGDDALVRVLYSETMRRPRHEVARYLIRGSSVPERDVEGAGLSVFQVGGHLKYGEAPDFGIEEALACILEKKPLLLCVDEAHEMCPEFGQHLLQVAQDLVSTGSPLLLVLAGTPSSRVTCRQWAQASGSGAPAFRSAGWSRMTRCARRWPSPPRKRACRSTRMRWSFW